MREDIIEKPKNALFVPLNDKETEKWTNLEEFYSINGEVYSENIFSREYNLPFREGQSGVAYLVWPEKVRPPREKFTIPGER